MLLEIINYYFHIIHIGITLRIKSIKLNLMKFNEIIILTFSLFIFQWFII